MADALQAVAGRRGWIISDGKAGHEAQARGVAEALGLAVEIKRVAPATPWSWLSPWGPVAPSERFGSAGEPVSSAVARLRVRHRPADHPLHPPPEADGGACHLHGDPARPEGVAEHGRPVLGARARQAARAQCHHDADGAAHLLGRAACAELRSRVPAEIAALPSPRVAVLLGGPNGDYRYTPPRVAHLASALQSLGALGAGLMITASRRTPPDVVAFLREQTAWQPHLFWDGEGENPYAQFLAQADAFIVPADSVNMTGEPCATGKPIYVFEPEGGSPKFARFHDALRRHGATRPLPARFERLETWSYAPLNSASVDRRRDRPPLGQAPADARRRRVTVTVIPASRTRAASRSGILRRLVTRSRTASLGRDFRDDGCTGARNVVACQWFGERRSIDYVLCKLNRRALRRRGCRHLGGPTWAPQAPGGRTAWWDECFRASRAPSPTISPSTSARPTRWCTWSAAASSSTSRRWWPCRCAAASARCWRSASRPRPC